MLRHWVVAVAIVACFCEVVCIFKGGGGGMGKGRGGMFGRRRTTTTRSPLIDGTGPYSTPSTEPPGPRGCPPPRIAFNDSVLRSRGDYHGVIEVKFVGVIGSLNQRRLCKLKCIEGAWQGPLCSVEEQKKGDVIRYQPMLRNCELGLVKPNVVISYRGAKLEMNFGLSFPTGESINVHCAPLGLYKLIGNSTMVCSDGSWSGRTPSCLKTTMLTNYSESYPPSIILNVPTGSAAVDSRGVLVVYPGSIIHLDCVFSRKIGNPEWAWTPTFRQYPTGWAIAPEERDLRYRLSIYYTTRRDSGTYTCATPRGLTSSFIINVTAVRCPPLEVEDPTLIVNSEGNKAGYVTSFMCPQGFVLNGTANISCSATGEWDGDIPHCEVVHCPPLEFSDVHIQVVSINYTSGGRMVFECMNGYQLRGSKFIVCQSDGKWSKERPWCEAIECSPPLPPLNGRLLHNGRYLVGDTVQYACNSGHQLVGEAMVVCTEMGVWSHPPPYCKLACDFPGRLSNGRVEPTKFYYEVGDRIMVTCHTGYVVSGRPRIQCQSDGTWSAALPKCVEYYYA